MLKSKNLSNLQDKMFRKDCLTSILSCQFLVMIKQSFLLSYYMLLHIYGKLEKQWSKTVEERKTCYTDM